MRTLTAVGLVFAVLVGLVLLYSISQNGRYVPMPLPLGNEGAFIIVDSYTGAWHVDLASQKDLDDARRRRK